MNRKEYFENQLEEIHSYILRTDSMIAVKTSYQYWIGIILAFIAGRLDDIYKEMLRENQRQLLKDRGE